MLPTEYVYSSIVYLSDWGDEFSGGETVFLRSMDGPEGAQAAAKDDNKESSVLFPMRQADIVQPKVGRVALFTGGEENMHCKMPSAAKGGGEPPRLVVQMWVQCVDPEAGGGATPKERRAQAAAKAMERGEEEL